MQVSNAAEEYYNEAALMAGLSHPNILTVYAVITSPQDGTATGLLSEHMTESLHDYIYTLPA